MAFAGAGRQCARVGVDCSMINPAEPRANARGRRRSTRWSPTSSPPTSMRWRRTRAAAVGPGTRARPAGCTAWSWNRCSASGWKGIVFASRRACLRSGAGSRCVTAIAKPTTRSWCGGPRWSVAKRSDATSVTLDGVAQDIDFIRPRRRPTGTRGRRAYSVHAPGSANDLRPETHAVAVGRSTMYAIAAVHAG